jgi:hypothetical protein
MNAAELNSSAVSNASWHSASMNAESIEFGDRAILSLSRFCRDCGISPVTAWRWRRAGWLKTVNIAGRQYLTRHQLEEFMRRVEAGEFARRHVAPVRQRNRF